MGSSDCQGILSSCRLELKGKYLLGEFLDFKGKQDDIQALRNIKRSKVNRLIIQKTSMFGLASTGELLPANPDILEGVDDLIQLSYLNEPSLLHNLHFRFTHDAFYVLSSRHPTVLSSTISSTQSTSSSCELSSKRFSNMRLREAFSPIH
ncbi:hypothetical protein POM88_010307 [Heracleum sosnowskyi]|uniref:Uncharacterized protein n=1 Tax=Heracleum sosnowskyi TaxID=360622 RepID=A0AAD8IT83_9APIA|nr:hypothetical protein POM88_010307 [Heracleum sosnowskyi]